MSRPGVYGIREVPHDTPQALTCGTCGRSWLEDITPSGRCPWEFLRGHSPLRGDEIAEMVEHGFGAQEIVDTLGMKPASITQALRRAGHAELVPFFGHLIWQTRTPEQRARLAEAKRVKRAASRAD